MTSEKRQEKKINARLLKAAFFSSLPVMAGYVFLGIAFGILFQSKGYGVFWALVMSVFVYAGTMQFVAVNLISGGASLITAALTTVMVNARHLFYAISMIDAYKGMGKKKAYLMFALTDETYSLVCRPSLPEGVDRGFWSFFLSMFNQCYWIIGSVLGSVIGAQLSFNSTGIDFAMTALFISVFTEQWLGSKDRVPAITGVVISLACLLAFGPDKFLIPAMLGITAGLTVIRKARMARAGEAGEGGDDDE